MGEQALERLEEMCRHMGNEEEGFVVEFEDGQRFKFKGSRYLELHRLISSFSYKHTLEALAGGTFDQMIESVPDEYLTQVKQWQREILARVDMKTNECHLAFQAAPKTDRKTFALWVTQECKDISQYMFALLDEKPIEPLIYKNLLREA